MVIIFVYYYILNVLVMGPSKTEIKISGRNKNYNIQIRLVRFGVTGAINLCESLSSSFLTRP